MGKKGDVILGVGFLAIGIGVMLESLRYRLGTAQEPLPGMFPFGAGVMLAVLSAVLLGKARRGATAKTGSLHNLWRPARMILGLGIYIVLCSLFGYISAATVLSVIVLRTMETKRWGVVIACSLGVAVGSYLLFKPLLGLPLPVGSLIHLE